MDTKTFIALVEASGYEVRSYSGRRMYGKKCVGITLEQGQNAFVLAMHLAKVALDEATGEDPAEHAWEVISEMTSLNIAEDSMGTGSVVYFPELKWED